MHGPREAATAGLGNPVAAITGANSEISYPGDAANIDYPPASEPFTAFRIEAQRRSRPLGIPDLAFSETFRGWATVCLKVRDDLVLLPPLPFEVWAGGTLLLLLLAVLRVAAFRRLIRRAEPAPQDVLEMVSDAAKKIGLSAPPQTSMVHRCMSPMVWCAVRPRLLLPRELWSDLDDIGRRAVVMHELAHLRRRDHWVLWADSIVGSLYWWHPLVWFVRRRMQMEAEYCCDAWVTSLLPKTRRAYAQALLKTRQFLGEGAQLGFVPAMGMGISSGRANRFARRLTMVMTKSSKPGASLWGVALVLLIATSGWLVSPARSCPEEEKAKAASAPCANAKPCAEPAPCAKAQADEERAAAKAAEDRAVAVYAGPKDQEKTSYERHMAMRALAPAINATAAEEKALAEALYAGAVSGNWKTVAGGDDEQRRIRELQMELERLGRQLESLNAQIHGAKAGKVAKRKDGRSEHAHEHDDDHAHGLFHAHPTPPAPPVPPGQPAPPRSPRAGRIAPMPAMPAMPAMPPMPPMPPTPPVVAPRGHGGPHAMFAPAVPGQTTPRPRAIPKPGQTWADVEKGEMEWRTYKLSDGKRGPFTEFMSRSDVPVLVRANPEGIDIQATPPQHRVFRAFFQLIDPMEERADADFGPDGFGVGFGQALGWGQAFGGCEGCPGCKCGKCSHAREARVYAERIREEARAMANNVRERAQGEGAKIRAEARARANEVRDRLRQESRRIRTEAENQDELIRSLEREAETLREHGERMRERSERIRERADRVRERAEQSDDDDAANEALIEHMRELERNAEGLNAEAEALNAKAAELTVQLETVRGGSTMLEGHADEVEHRADAIDELTDSIEGLEAGPELAMSIAELAAQIEHLATSGAGPAAEEWITALSMPEIPDGLTGEALEDALEAAAEALEEAVEEAAEAAAEEVEADLESDDASDDSDEDEDDDDDEESADDEDSEDDDGGEDDEDGGTK